jgi:hypothetical protein
MVNGIAFQMHQPGLEPGSAVFKTAPLTDYGTGASSPGEPLPLWRSSLTGAINVTGLTLRASTVPRPVSGALPCDDSPQSEHLPMQEALLLTEATRPRQR